MIRARYWPGIPSMGIFSRLFISMLSLVVVSATIIVNTCNAKTPKFSSILIFGDSLLDTGNNNYIEETPMKANFLPYGRDFPGHIASGRFSNARLISDLLASILYLKNTVPPYLDPNLNDHDLLTGVNFASAGAGLDGLTLAPAFVIPVSQQIDHFKNYRTKFKRIAGEEEAHRMLQNAFVLISAGTNDIIMNFYLTPTRSVEFGFNISRYQDFLLDRLQSIIQELHELGLRRLAIVGLPPLGCIPNQIAFKSPNRRSCVTMLNSDAKLYNAKLEKLLPRLQQQLPGSRLVYVDIYNIILDMNNHPAKYGFEVVERGCCGSGLVEFSAAVCIMLSPTCDDASKYLFWDASHPTEAANIYIAQYLKQHVIPKFQLQH